ncbi:MAG: hypothetical protein BGO07_00470 [Alphaproteobacteria bacterium 40-19]|nr:MAG: hypothetical protein BGO07_00470 [Alphaproteobacteria bacterium 40-19]
MKNFIFICFFSSILNYNQAYAAKKLSENASSHVCKRAKKIKKNWIKDADNNHTKEIVDINHKICDLFFLNRRCMELYKNRSCNNFFEELEKIEKEANKIFQRIGSAFVAQVRDRVVDNSTQYIGKRLFVAMELLGKEEKCLRNLK